MYLWDYPKTGNPSDEDPVWFLERVLHYGAGGEKLRREFVLRHFSSLRIPEHTRRFF